MKQVVKNAVVAIVGTNFEGKKSRIHLLHVGNDGKMRGAFHYGERGEHLHSNLHSVLPLTTFNEWRTHREWLP